MSLQLSEKFSLPEKAVLWTIADLAVKDAGKTYAACVLAEEMVKHGYPILAIDPLGIWWGLRVGKDEKSHGLEIVIFGGDHKDISIPLKQDLKHKRPIVDEDRLKLLVKAILESRINAVIDTSEFSKNQQHRIGGIVCEEIFRLNKNYGIRHVFIEEADMLAPQKLFGENAFSLGAVDDLVRRGGNYNIGVTLITQRSAVLNKDVLTQCNLLMALRIESRLDKDAVKAWVESKVKDEKEQRKLDKWYDSLARLEKGEAWLYSPGNKIELTKIQVRERETLHATREFFLREQWEQKDIRMMDVNSFVTKFKAVFEPKPKVVQVNSIGKEASVPVSFGTSPGASQDLSVSELPLPTGNPPAQQTIDILRSNPVIQTQRTITGIIVPGDADHPKTALGKLAVIMKDDSRHSQHWTPTRARKQFEVRQWPTDGLEEAFNQMIAWGILKIQSNKAYSFYAARVEITEKTVNVIAP